MVRIKKMNAIEMEQGLISRGAVPVPEEFKKQPWYKELSMLPPCLKPHEVAENATKYGSNKTN